MNPGDAPLAIRIHHTMLPVADLDRSLAFYAGLLGMAVYARYRSAGGAAERAFVGYGDPASQPAVELASTGDASPPAPRSGHLGIDVRDLEAICALLRRAGVTFVREPETRESRGSPVRTARVCDPDGHVVELNERA